MDRDKSKYVTHQHVHHFPGDMGSTVQCVDYAQIAVDILNVLDAILEKLGQIQEEI